MARRKRVLRRTPIKADRDFNSILVSRLVNRVMWDGKKTVATKIVVTALKGASEALQVEPVEVLEKALDNAQPLVEVKSVRVGGSNYQVPIEPYPARQWRLGLTWIVDSARKMKGKAMAEKLQSVLTDSYNNEGPAVAKKETVHQTAAGNKAFAHLASRISR